MAILDSSLADLRATRTSVKWRHHPPDVLPLWVAEMDARPCPEVVAAVTAALQRGDTGYAVVGPFAGAFAGFAERHWGWRVEASAALAVPDVMIGIEEVLHRHVPADRAVVVSPPCYNSFFEFIECVDRRLVTARLDADRRLDPEALERAFADAGRGSAYLLCNPQNPTGTVHTAAELAAVARLADEYGVLVIADEIHAPLVHPGVTFTPYLSVPEAARGIAVVSGSKAFNLAGLKAALAFAGPDAADTLGALNEAVTHGAQHLAVIAQTEAFAAGDRWLSLLHEELADRRRLLGDLVAEHLPGVVVEPAEATFLAWLDCSALGLPDAGEAFLERGRVALGMGPAYDPGATDFVRFNLGTSAEVIEEAVRRMATAVRGSR